MALIIVNNNNNNNDDDESYFLGVGVWSVECVGGG